MTTFNKVRMKNFMSYGRQFVEVDLNTKKKVLIQGQNMDVGETGDSKNGTGKSSSYFAVLFAAYGKWLGKNKADELINIKNEKGMVVELEFTSNEGREYLIRRGRKPAILEFYQGDINLTRDSMKNTDEDIQEVLGIGFEVFIRSVFLSSGVESFVDMSGAEQRSLIEEILSIDMLSRRAETLKLMRKDLQVDKRLIDRDFENAEQNNARVDQMIDSTITKYQNFEEQRNQKISDANEMIEVVGNVDIHFHRNQLAEATEYDLSCRELSSSLTVTRGKIDSLKTSVETMKQKHDDVDDIFASQKQWEDSKQENLRKIQEQMDERTIDADIDMEKEKHQKIRDLEEEIQKSKRSKERSEYDLKHFEADLKKKKDDLDALKNGEQCNYCGGTSFDESHIKGHEAEIRQVERYLTEKQEVIYEIEKNIEQMQDQVEVTKNSILIEDCGDYESKLLALLDKYDAVEAEKNPYVKQMDDIINRYGTKEDILVKISEAEQKITELEEEVTKIKCEIDVLKEKSEDIRKNSMDQLGTDSYDEISRIHAEYNEAVNTLEQLKGSKNPFEGQVEELKTGYIDKEELEIKKKDLDKKEDHINHLIRMLTDSKSFIRKSIVDQYVPFLNKRINEYIREVGLLHTFMINSDLSVELTYMGRTVSHHLMSKGERLRLGLSTSLAFRDLLAMLGKSFNLMMVDELLDDGSDAYFVRKATGLLKEEAETLFVVSHREEIVTMFDEKMVVIKENGFSRIE